MADSVSSAIGLATTLVSAIGSGASLVKGFTSKSPKSPEAPVLSKPAVMPTQDDNAIRHARLAAIERRQQASGRASTILTDQEHLGS